MITREKSEHGFTLTELLVGMGIFSIVGLAMVSFTSRSFRILGVETKASEAAAELRNGIALLSTELRMSTSISPYIVGNVETVVNCSSQVAITGNTVRFLVTEDDASSSSSGMKAYYVGYQYNTTTGELLRGEVQAPSVYNCTLPASDPLSTSNAKTLARKVVLIDSNSNGSLEPAFALSGGSLVVNLGVEVQSADNRRILQPTTTRIQFRGS